MNRKIKIPFLMNYNLHEITLYSSLYPLIPISSALRLWHPSTLKKVMPNIIATVQELLSDTLHIYRLKIAFGTSDADTGCNWTAHNITINMTIQEMFPESLISKYTDIDVDLLIVYRHPLTGILVISRIRHQC